MPKPRLPKRVGPSPALREPVITEGDLAIIQQARILREKLQTIYKTACPCCGARPTIPGLARVVGVKEALLYRFISNKQQTLMQENFEKISKFVAEMEEKG